MKSQVLIIMILLISVFIGFGIIIPVFPEIVEEKSAAFHVGMMLAVYSAASFLMSPVWGALSDRWGRRPIIMIGLAGFSVSFFLFGISTDHLTFMYASRIMGGFFSGAVTACCIAYVADITSQENRTRGMGMVGMSIGLGFVIGPGVGGVVSHFFGNEMPFFVSSVLSLAALLFAAVRLTESLTPDKRRSAAGEKGSRLSAFRGTLKYLYMLSFVVAFTLAGLEGVLQLFQKETIGITPLQMGIMFMISGVVGAGVQGGVVRRYVKNGQESRFIRYGLLLSSAGFLLLIFSVNLWTATVFLCIFSFGNALIRPCVISLITQKTKSGQGVATGLVSSIDSLGRIIGPLLAMGMFYVEIYLPLLAGGILCAAALLLLRRFLKLEGTNPAASS